MRRLYIDRNNTFRFIGKRTWKAICASKVQRNGSLALRITEASKSGLSTISRGDARDGKFAKCRNAQAELRNCGTDYWLAKLGETGGRGWAG